LTHFDDQGDSGEENPMITIVEKILGLFNEMVVEIWNLSNDAEGT